MKISTVHLPLLLLAGPSSVQSFGGFFGREGPERQVSQSGDVVIFGLADNKVQLQVKIDFELNENINSTNDNSFGWIVPLPAVPTKVDVGSSLLFHSLFQETLPRFVLEIQDGITSESEATEVSDTDTDTSSATSRQGNMDRPLVRGETCDATSIGNLNCPVQGPTRGVAGVGPVQVWAEGQAGWLDYQVLEGHKDSVMDWMTENGYGNSGNVNNLLDHYDASGSVYVVLKVASTSRNVDNGNNKHSVQPLLIEYDLPAAANPGTEVVHMVPTLLSGATALPRTLQVYFLSDQADSRATPVNYLDVTLDDAFADWVGCLSPTNEAVDCYYKDYQDRFAAAIKPVANQTMTTEYAGPVDALFLQGNKVGIDVLPADLELSATWVDFLRQLEAAGLPAIPAVHAILDQYIPPKTYFSFMPPFQCAQWEHVYQPFRTSSPSMYDCFDVFQPTDDWTWDPVGLSTALEADILAPARQAQTALDTKYESLTRLYGLLVAPDKIPDPHFVVNTNKPQVSNIHTATAIPLCDLGSPSALEITIQATPKENMTFWQPALLRCPTWVKASPKPVFSAEDALVRVDSLASLFTAWGIGESDDIQVPRENGLFLYESVNTALDYGDALLGTLIHPQGDASNVVEVPGVPASGTTHIAVMEPTDDAWENPDSMLNGSDATTCGQWTMPAMTVLAVAVLAGAW